MRLLRARATIGWAVCLWLLGNLVFGPVASHAATAEAIDTAANRTLDQFRSEFADAPTILREPGASLSSQRSSRPGLVLGVRTAKACCE